MIKGLSKLLLLSLVILVGCSAVRVYDTDPSYKEVKNDYFYLLIEPQPAARGNFFNAFRFVFENRTDKPMTIDWANTHYIHNGRRNGQFGWDGMKFEDLEKIRKNPHAKIEADETISEIIFPINLLARMSLSDRARLGGPGPEGQFAFGPLPEGKNGMLLTVVHSGKKIQETLVFNIREAEAVRDLLAAHLRHLGFETVAARDRVVNEQIDIIESLRNDLRDSVLKTRELRAELSDRATENVKSEVRLRDVQTELSVAQASTDLLATGVLDYSVTPDGEDDVEPSNTVKTIKSAS